MVPVRDRLWHRLLKRGGDYFMTLRYAAHPRPIVLVVDGTVDALALRPLFLALQASYPPTNGGAAITSSGNDLLLQRPPRVVLTGRTGDATSSCLVAARALGNTVDSRSHKANMCNPDTFASAWNLAAGRHYPRRQGAESGGGGRDHVLTVDLAAGLAGAVEALKPLAIVSVAGTGPSAGAGAPGGVGGGGAAIDEALAVVGGQGGVPLIRLPREQNASKAALWLTRLTPKAFRAWHKPQVDIVVVYEPSSRSGDGNGGHTEAQLKALLESLSNAHYLGETVGLTVTVGSGPVPDIVGDDDLFSWPRGRKVVRGGSLFPSSSSTATARSGGRYDSSSLAALAFRSWVPQNDDNFVVVLEADRVVSRFFYSWLKVTMLETSYAGAASASAAAAPSARSGAAAETRTGVCVPGVEPSSGGNGVGGDTWLLPGGYWRAAQAGCLGESSAAAGGEGRRRGGGRSMSVACGETGYPEPPQRSFCPALKEPAEALVGRTGADGQLLGKAQHGLMEDGQALADFVARVLF